VNLDGLHSIFGEMNECKRSSFVV